MASPAQLKASDQKRVCLACAAVLSRYNQDSLCLPCQRTQAREKLAAQLAGSGDVTPEHTAAAAEIQQQLQPKTQTIDRPEQRWCDGCQKYRFAGAWGARGICRFCEVKPAPTSEVRPEVVGTSPKDPAAVALGRLGGQKGGAARAAAMTPEQRQEAARNAAIARWSKDVEPVITEESPPSVSKALPTEVVQESAAESASEPPAPTEETVARARNALLPEQWSRLYEKCVQCGMTDSPHASKGFCARCRNEIRGRQTAELMNDVRRENQDLELADYQLLHEMLGILPKDGRWKPRQRALWLRGFTSLLDYLIDEPPCESAGHHACKHYVGVAQKAIEASTEMEWCAGCAAERPYKGNTPLPYMHEKDCPLAAIVKEGL